MLGLERIALEREVCTIKRRLLSAHDEQILEKTRPASQKVATIRQHRKIAAQGVSGLGSVDNIHTNNEHDTQAEYQYEKLG